MGASVFVGRVGGLAVALGVGAAMFSTGMGVAFADSGSQTNTSTASAGKTSGANRVARAPRVRAAKPAATTRKARSAAADPVAADPEPVAVESPVDVPEPAVGTEAPEVIAYSAVPDSGLDKTVGNRRGFAKATATDPLTANPGYEVFDGVLQGNFNVTSASGCGAPGSTCTLTYEFVSSSKGGKANLPTKSSPSPVPAELDPLLAPSAKGGPGSFTFLPYATWIDPASPSRAAAPTAQKPGTQDFTVRIAENTQFDQTVTGLPLIGGLAEPIIKLFQDWGILTGLVGASLLSTVTVNPNLALVAAGGTQVAYTYKVSSFDGTKISMNYFPASLNTQAALKPALGDQQATIFNGPGLGSPGETKPYEAYQASGSVPGLGLMRGQGLPAPLTNAPVGFNVITWDPRGEWDSGGVLQLDNPFFEGRDVSALIDWANANTPLLNEKAAGALVSPCSPGDAGCKPDVAMLGGSYGGGIQLTTIDPRIKAIVPSIAWNSLNQSLYPDSVFKTGWANVLASALLLTGASSVNRINSQVTQALITGNLFGYISDSAQAVLASSGPTTLLTKLNIPTMYDQGIVDGLFPLQQALENAQTQLEQNPYFADKQDQVKMIWFNGGHGVPTNVLLQPNGADLLRAQTTLMFLENMIWVNNYTKNYLGQIPTGLPAPAPQTLKELTAGLLAFTPVFQWWDQKGTALASYDGMPYSDAFQDTSPIAVTGVGPQGSLRSLFTQASGPLTTKDPAGAVCASISSACEFPLNQVIATESKDAINIAISVPATTDPDNPSVVVGAPTVSFTYSGTGNAKAIYAQIVDNATGQVLGNINTPIPVTLKNPIQLGKPEVLKVTNFPIANIAYTAPEGAAGSLTLQLVAKASSFKNNDVIWNIDISDISVSLPTTGTAIPNPLPALIPG
ncbi:MAG: CocE/NonD family hydrolase [Mycobacterium sp.]